MLPILSCLPCSFLLTSLFLAATALPVESAVTQLRQLTAADFSTSTKRGVWFVEFFSPYCGHCKNFAPTWEHLVQYVEAQADPGISLAQVNCVTDRDLCNQNDVLGYPSLKLYRDGNPLDEFSDDREFDLLTKFVDKHARKADSSDVSLNPNGVVLPLDKKIFQMTIDGGPTFVKFYAPWCGYCKKLAPTWVQFASRMKGIMTVAEVNCDDHGSLCSSQGVAGYPTLFFYQHSRKLDYTGRRTLEAMESFVTSALAPPLTTISLFDLSSIIERYDVSFLLIHDQLDPEVRDDIEEACRPLLGSPPIFSIAASSEVLASLSLPPTQPLPVIVTLKDSSMVAHKQLLVSQSLSVEQISDWLMMNSLPMSAELNGENFQRIMGPSSTSSGVPSRLVVLGAINTQHSAHIDVIKQTATAWHRGEQSTDAQVVFVWMDKEKWGSWLKSVYGVKQGPDPTVIIADHSHLLYYDSLSSGALIMLDKSSIFAALEGIHNGVLKSKHSENIAERFMRWLNGWVLGIQSSISHHPVRSVLFLAVVVSAIVFGIKRVLVEDPRNTSVYINSKSGGRLD